MRLTMADPFDYMGQTWPAGDYELRPVVQGGRLIVLLRRVR